MMKLVILCLTTTEARTPSLGMAESLQRLKQHHLMLVTNIIFYIKNQKRRFNGSKIQENSNKIFIQNQ